MDFLQVFTALKQHKGDSGSSWQIMGLERSPNLSGFCTQETDLETFPVEYVKQSGCGDYGYYGTIYFPTTYPDGDGGVLYLRVDYADV